jgi:hypothetical protein
MTLHEPTTSITDFILGAEALILAVCLINGGSASPSLPYWTTTLILLGVAAILGGFTHGLACPAMFVALYPCLAFLMAAFVIATLTDIFGAELSRRALWLVGIMVLVFVPIAWRFPKHLQAYAVAGVLIMVPALIIYLKMALHHKLPGSGYIATGIAATIIGVALLLRDVQLKLIYTFDRNGLNHLAQMVGVLFFYLGLSLRTATG